MISQETIDAVWSKARMAQGFDASMYRLDACGALIMRDKYGKVNPFGWEIDHIYPQSRGGDDQGDKGQVPVTGYLSPRLPESLNQPSANACKSL